MDRQEIEAALAELGTELDRQGVAAKIFVVGGAAMVLAFRARTATEDVDVAAVPAERVLSVAAAIGDRRGLRPGWLDDSAKIFVPPFKEPDWRPVMRIGRVEVVAADARSLLAMKIRASRGRRDEGDVRFLLGRCGIGSYDQAVELYREFFPEDPLPRRAVLMLRGLLPAGDPAEG